MKGNIKKKIENKMTSSKKRTVYWKVYDRRYKIYNPKSTYTLISSITNTLNRPFTERRKVGRIPILPHRNL